MAETSKNKIYYNDDENSVADVLTDMKKMAESTDEAIEKSKYNDTQIKKDISNIQKEQTTQNIDISNIKKEQETQNTNIEENNSKIVELQTEKAKLETELKEMQEDFYQNSIRGQVSGEYIHVEDSSNCRAKIGIGGNHEQETNLYNGGLELGSINNTGEVSASNRVRTMKSIEVKENTKIKVSANGAEEFLLVTYNSNKEFQNITSWADLETSVTIPTGIKYIRIVLRKKDNSSITSLNITNFVVGDTPSLDYPSKIKTVGSNVNMFNKDNYIKSKLYINKNENKFSEASMGKSFIFDISKYNKLTISKVSSERFGVFASVDYPQKDGVGTYLQDAATNATSFSYDFAKFNYLVVFYYFTRDTLTEQEILDSIKIVEGTEVGEYSKYGQGCVKVTKCNENILDTSTTKKVKNQNGEERTGYFCKITKTGKYYLMLNTANTLYFGKSTELNNATTLIGSTSLTFSTTYDFNEGEYFILWGTKTDTDKIMVILSDKQQEYIEHQEQSYIMPVQKEMLEGDCFDWDNEEEVHTWNKLVLDGTETFNSWTGKAPSGYSVFFSKILINTINSQGDLKCNTLKYIENPWESGKNAIGLQRTFKELYISIESKYASTLEEFKTYLKSQYDTGTPVIIYYMLATPTRLKFTDEQKAVAKELNNARTYKNVTNITTDSKAILSLDYAKDLETLLTSKESEV